MSSHTPPLKDTIEESKTDIQNNHELENASQSSDRFSVVPEETETLTYKTAIVIFVSPCPPWISIPTS